LLQRAVEILEKLAELSGFISRKGFVVTQIQNVSAEQRQTTLRDVIGQYRAARGLVPLPERMG